MENYIGEIRLFAGNFAPQGWALCDGSRISKNENQVLYSLIGDLYGNYDQNTFALPDLKGRVVVGTGKTQFVSNYVPGMTGGKYEVSPDSSSLPAHTHDVNVSAVDAMTSSPKNAYLAKPVGYSGFPDVELYTPNTTGATTQSMDKRAVNASGLSRPHNNIMPYLSLNYIIALEGLYPMTE